MRDYFKKMFALIRKQHIIFRKLVRKIFRRITLTNATCFQQVLENYVKALQTNENWITHKQMLAATLSTPVVLLQMSECSIFVFAVIFAVLTHWFSTAPPDARILARKTLFQQQYLKTPFWMNGPWDGFFRKSCRHVFHHMPKHQKGMSDQSALEIGLACCFMLQD